MSNPIDDLISHEEHTNVERPSTSVPGSDPAALSDDVDYLTDDDMPDLVDDEGRIVDAAVTDGPEETREARTSFPTPLHRGGMTWPPLQPPHSAPRPASIGEIVRDASFLSP